MYGSYDSLGTVPSDLPYNGTGRLHNGQTALAGSPDEYNLINYSKTNRTKARQQGRLRIAKARFRIKRLTDWKELKETDVHAAARAQDFERTVTALSILAGCPIEMAERAVLNANPGAVQVIAKVAGCSWATVKNLLLMEVADRKMSKLISTGRASISRSLSGEPRSACWNLTEARRNMLAQAPLPVASTDSAELQAAG